MLINLIFMFDILVSFRTTYINTNTGDEVYNGWAIAKRYVVGGRFIIDFLSSVPFDIVNLEQTAFLRIFGMLKLV